MRCPACDFDAPAGMRFCGRCGHQLGTACPRCGFENRPDFNFCGQCAAPLNGTSPGANFPAGQTAGVPGCAERRPVTVLFCDLVESTALAGQLDPEELREVVVRYQQAVAAAIECYAGYIAQYLGDGVLVYFGYPEAHEESARRAVSSGLALLDATSSLNRELQQQWDMRLAVRVGIHSGLVVAGDVGVGGRTDQLVLGQTPNVAARLESLAEPDTVLLSRTTFDMVQGFFECEALGPHQFKGLAEPIEVFRALRQTGVRSRFQLTLAGGLTPMVGRRREGNRLLDIFEEAEDGHGQLVAISGEAGIGKSRLQQWLKEQVSGRVDAWFTCYCLPYYQNTALNPLTDMLESQLGFASEDTSEERLAKLDSGLTRWGFLASDSSPFFASLLSLPAPPMHPPLNISPPRLKQEIMQRLVGLLFHAAERRPAVLVIEDIHWADPSTLEFIDVLLQQLPQHRMLVVLSHRPDFDLSPSAKHRARRIVLDRLQDRDTETMIEEIAVGIRLPREIRDEIVTQTDGVPIYIEELTKMILDSGLVEKVSGKDVATGKLRTLGIPLTLQDSLLSRLDRLGAAKEVAQLGAVLGRSFRYEVLAAIGDIDESSLKYHLRQLVGAGLFCQQGELPEATYSFKHALVQDAAYESLLRRRRHRLHEQVAEVFLAQFPEIGETEPEILAYHLEAGGHPDRAVRYLCVAGKRAQGHSAYIEAIRHFEKGLELLKDLPATAGHRELELELLLSLGIGLIATQGYAAERVESTYARAMEVCEELGDIPFQARYGIWAVAIVRGDREATSELADWLRGLVKDVDDPTIAMMSHAALGTWAFYRGDYALAEEHLQRSIELFDPGQHHAVTREYAAGGAFFGHMVTTLSLWFTGFPDRACAHQERVISLAETLSDPYTLALSLLYEANLGHELGDVDRVWAAAQRADRMLTASEHDFLFLAAVIKIIQGWVLAHQGQADKGVAQLRDGLDSYRATGARILVPYYMAYLTEALLAAARPDEALPAVEQAISLSQTNLDSFYEPELQRLRGRVLQQLGADSARLEACFRDVLDAARRQGSKALELRAATSLAGVLTDCGKAEEAESLLERAYHDFSEGFATRDLREARALLDQMQTAARPSIV